MSTWLQRCILEDGTWDQPLISSKLPSYSSFCTQHSLLLERLLKWTPGIDILQPIDSICSGKLTADMPFQRNSDIYLSVCFNSNPTIELPSKKLRLILGIIWKCLLTRKLFMNSPKGKKGSMKSRPRESKLSKSKH